MNATLNAIQIISSSYMHWRARRVKQAAKYMNPTLNTIQIIPHSNMHWRARRASPAAKYIKSTLNAHNFSHCRAKRAGSFGPWLKLAMHSVVAPTDTNVH